MISRRSLVSGGGVLLLTACTTPSALKVKAGLPLPSNVPLKELDVVVQEGYFPGNYSVSLSNSGYFGHEWQSQFGRVVDGARATYGLSGRTIFFSPKAPSPVNLQSRYVANLVPKTMTWRSQGGWLDIDHEVTVTDRFSKVVHFSGGVMIKPYAQQRKLYIPEKRREGEILEVFKAMENQGLIKTTGK